MRGLAPVASASSDLDVKIQKRAFIALLAKLSNCPLNLSDSLRKLQSPPRFARLAPALNQLLRETGLSVGETADLQRFLRKFYLDEVELSENMQGFSTMTSSCSDAGPVPEALEQYSFLEIFSKARADGESVLNLFAMQFAQTPEKYLNSYLCRAKAVSPQEKIYFLRKFCTALFIEEKSMGRFQICIQKAQQELTLSKADLQKCELWTHLLTAYMVKVEHFIKAQLGSDLLKYQFFLGVDVKVQLACVAIEEELDQIFADTRGSKRFAKFSNLRQKELIDSKLNCISEYMLAFLAKHRDSYPKGEVAKWVAINERFLRFFKARFYHDQMCRWLIHYQEIYIDRFADAELNNRSECISILIGAWHFFLELQKKSKRVEVNGIYATHLQFFQGLVELHAKRAKWIATLYNLAYKRLCQALKETKIDEQARKMLLKCLTVVEGCEMLPVELAISKKPKSELSTRGSLSADSMKIDVSSRETEREDAPDIDLELELKLQQPLESANSNLTSIPFLTTLTSEEQLLQHPATQKFPFYYAERVARWFTAQVPLAAEAFGEYSRKGVRHQQFEVVKHGFSPLADMFSHRALNFTKTLDGCGNQLRNFVLPAELTWEGETNRGYISWVINASNSCFHRYFHVKSEEDFVEVALRQKFHESDFPTLGAHVKSRKESRGHIGKFNVEIDDLLGIATILHIGNGAKLKLFLVQSAQP